MSNDFKINDKALKDLKLLMESKAMSEIRRVEHVQGLRGEVTANWLDSFMNRMYQNEISNSPKLVDAKTGKVHTVESMVADLRDRVKLDVLTKESQEREIPLSKKMAEQQDDLDMKDIVHVIENFLTSHRGHADDQAILYTLRDTFGEDKINKLSDQITKKIEQLRGELAEPLLVDDSLSDAALGQPLKLDDQDMEKDLIFTNIQDGLGGGKK